MLLRRAERRSNFYKFSGRLLRPTSLAMTFCCALLFLACQKAPVNQPEVVDEPKEPAHEIAAPAEAPKSISVANLILYPNQGEPTTIKLEIARTPDERRQGLKGRENLANDYGMWFVFEEDMQDPFWMKDTPVSLDMLFIDKDYKIVDLVRDTIPNSELLIVSRQKYRYALEVKAGLSRAWGLDVGDRVEFRLGP